jgi:hypothetical protein
MILENLLYKDIEQGKSTGAQYFLSKFSTVYWDSRS